MGLWKVIRLTAWWVYGLWINCQFEEFVELLPKKRTGLWEWWVFMAVGISSRTGFTRNADQRDEVLVWVSLHSQHQGICASLEALTPNTVSIILVIPPRYTPYYHGISPYLMTFVKHFPWTVKTTLCQHWIWDEDSNPGSALMFHLCTRGRGQCGWAWLCPHPDTCHTSVSPSGCTRDRDQLTTTNTWQQNNKH